MRYIRFGTLLWLFGLSIVFTYLVGSYKDTVLPSLSSLYYTMDNKLEQQSTREQSPYSATQQPDAFLNNLKACQEMRLKTFRRECEKVSPIYNTPVSDLTDSKLTKISGLVDDAHRFYMRAFAKTGCTSWKSILFNNTEGTHLPRIPRDVHTSHMKYGLHKMINEPSREDRVRKMEDYYVMLNVRHPLERLESAYRDKFAKPTIYREKYLKQLHSDPRKKNSPEAQDNEVSFAEFLDRVIEEEIHDMHWKPYLELHVCHMHADYIARTETSVADMNYIIKHRLANKGQYIASHSTGGLPIPKTSTNLSLFSSLENPKEYIEKLEGKLYKEDMDLFGYSYHINEESKEVTGYCKNVINGFCC